MNNDSLISVIIPIFNKDQYLGRCVNSILEQTHSNLQIILVDDGSTDSSGDICDSFAQGDHRIVVIHKENGGPVSARRAGLIQADGEYIGFVDADDYIEENMYEELLECLVTNDADFVYSGYYAEYKGYNSIMYLPEEEGLYYNKRKPDAISQCLFDKHQKSTMLLSLCFKLFKRDLILRCHAQVPHGLMFGDDFVCVGMCLLESDRIAFKRAAYYHYNIIQNSLSHPDDRISMILKCGVVYKALRDMFQAYGYLEEIEADLNDFYVRHIRFYLTGYNDLTVSWYHYKNIDMLLGKRVVIYCAGKVGQDCYEQLSKYASIDIVALADTYWEKYSLEYIDVVGPDSLLEKEFDLLVIAILDRDTAQIIRNSLIAKGIPEDKIKWIEPEMII